MWEGIGSAIGGLFGYKGQKDTNVASAQQAQKQMDFQKQMSNTAVQRRMADLKKAGINPILAGSKEASSPSGAMAPVGNKARAALENATSAQNIKNLIQQEKLSNSNTILADTNADIAHNTYLAGLGTAELGQQYKAYLQSPGGKAATTAQFYANSAAAVSGVISDFIPKLGTMRTKQSRGTQR